VKQVAWAGCGVAMLGVIQNLTGHGPEQPSFEQVDLALSRGLD